MRNNLNKKPILPKEIIPITSGSLQDLELSLIRGNRRRAEHQLKYLHEQKVQLDYLLTQVQDKINEIPKQKQKLVKEIEKSKKDEIRICGYVEPEFEFKAKIHDGCAGGVIHTSKDWPMDSLRIG